tara:strand:- start:530 stop:1435 length:906 start_codon:yes stop_codon:yes gene_type:complete
MTTLNLEGTFTALVTPFTNDEVDYPVLGHFVERQIAGGISGLVPVGTTGESPTLSHKEHLEVMRFVVETVNGRVPVIAGTGSNSTSEARGYTKTATDLGVDGCLQVAPYYNKPSQEGLYRHFATLAETTEKVQVLYSVPSRCGVEIEVETVRRLLKDYPHVCAIKEAGGDIEKVKRLRDACGSDLKIISGDDGLIVPFIEEGGCGVISVASNLAPRLVQRITQTALSGDFEAARALAKTHEALLGELVFIEGNPVTIKTVLDETGVLSPYSVRLPLCEMSAGNLARVRTLLANLDLGEDAS